jgi:cytochrome c-type biogenesis protein
MSGELYGTAAFALGAGIATFFSPCVYALLPGYVGYYVTAVEGESAPLAGAVTRGTAAAVGAVVTFAGLSVVALAAAAALERLLPLLEVAVGVFLIGLGVLAAWKGVHAPTVPLPARRAGVLGFSAFGAVYALAATACVLPLFLSVTVLSAQLPLAGAAVVLAAYAAGFTVVMLSATVAIAVGRRALLDRFGSHAGTLTRVAGVVLVAAGVVQLSIVAGVAPAVPIALP